MPKRITVIATFGFFPIACLAQAEGEIELAKRVLSNAQTRSIAENREYCGYFGYDANETLVSTPPTPGKWDECASDWPDDLDVVASWHTHAAYDEDAWSEVPSVDDMEADEDDGVDGYVSTPGGRLWFVDTTDMVTSQLCGLGCLVSDPDFVRGAEGDIAQSYSYRELLRREAE